MHPYFEKFTDCARKVLQFANEEARYRKYPLVGKIHILWGIVNETNNIAHQILLNLNIKTDNFKKQIEQKMGFMAYNDHGPIVPYAEDGRKCLLRSIEAMLKMEGRYFGCQYLLLGMLAEEDAVSAMLKEAGVTSELVMREIQKIVA
jgi:ATP-dependent Clp protease ATP-binding subunit ClpC